MGHPVASKLPSKNLSFIWLSLFTSFLFQECILLSELSFHFDFCTAKILFTIVWILETDDLCYCVIILFFFSLFSPLWIFRFNGGQTKVMHSCGWRLEETVQGKRNCGCPSPSFNDFLRSWESRQVLWNGYYDQQFDKHPCNSTCTSSDQHLRRHAAFMPNPHCKVLVKSLFLFDWSRAIILALTLYIWKKLLLNKRKNQKKKSIYVLSLQI